MRGGGDWRELVGESQVAFVLFLMLGSMSAFEHWKAVTHMVCEASEDACGSNLDFYGNFACRSRARQLERASEDFFADQLAEENFLAPAIVGRIRGMERGARGRAEGAAMETLRRANIFARFVDDGCLAAIFDDKGREGDEARRSRTPGSNEKKENAANPFDLEEGEDAPRGGGAPGGNVRADGRGRPRWRRGRYGDGRGGAAGTHGMDDGVRPR